MSVTLTDTLLYYPSLSKVFHSRPSWPLNIRGRGLDNISQKFVTILFPALFRSMIKYDFLFNALIFQTTIEKEKSSIVEKSPPSGILKWRIFLEKN